jgi:HEAT repeat protein
LLGVRLGVLLLPAVLLFLGTLRAEVPGTPRMTLFLGTAFQILLCFFSLRSLQEGRRAIGPSVLLLYLTGLGWLWLGRGLSDLDDWYLHLAQSLLLIGSMGVYAVQVLVDSGAPEWRRAHMLARRLAERTSWPIELAGCRLLPEVKALREALYIDATPALALLGHPKPQVRVAALAALEFRKHWRGGQAEAVLQVALQSPEPLVRAAAVSALANLEDRMLVEQLAEFLRDPSPEVRRSASEALLWDTANRWPWIRLAVRRALGDSHYPEESPLVPSGQQLTADAVKDLTAWAAEKGFLAVRSALTLGLHYTRILADQPDEQLVHDLQRQVADPRSPATLRIELANVLRTSHLLDDKLLQKMLDPLNPAPLRLIAADVLLAQGSHAGAVAAMREVARLPNREIALATAAAVQRHLGVDLGLPVGQAVPPAQSRLAAEVTRRVMAWAAESSQPEPAESAEPLHR